jgi:gluconate 5-dehydrogenase
MSESIVNDLFNLNGKVAIVTGGTGYLGSSISEGLLESGATVFITSRNYDKCKNAVKILKEKNFGNIYGVQLDITSMESTIECMEKIINEAGRIDILVNNAHLSAGNKLEDMSELQWIEGVNGTLNGVFRTTRAVIPIMKKEKQGSIINISSMYGIVSPNPSVYENTNFYNPANYGAGKAGIIQFTKYTACILAKEGIRVNSISPGPFPNEEVQKNKMFISRLSDKVPLGRIGQPKELKGSVIFLASNASSYITGTNLIVDGGWTAW